MEKPGFSSWSAVSVLSLFFASGIVVSRALDVHPGPAGFLSLSAGFLCGRTVSQRKNFALCLAFWVFVLGVQSWAVRSRPAADNIVNASGAKICLRGIVVSDPKETGPRAFLLKATGLRIKGKTAGVSGRVWVRLTKTVSGSSEEYSYGDIILLTGRLARPHSFNKRFLAARRADAVCYAREIERTGWDKTIFLGRLAYFIRHKLADSLNRYSPLAKAVLEALLLGVKSRLPAGVKNEAIRAGTWHVFVVSGSHVGLLVFVVTVVLKIFRIRRRERMIFSLGFVWLYCLVCGSSAPVLRATIMASVFLLSFLWERNPLYLHNLFLAGLLILLADPRELFSVGFQLSFLSVFFMTWLYPVFDFSGKLKGGRGPLFVRNAGVYAARAFVVSLCAWLGTAPVLIRVFGQISLAAVLANVFVLPLSGLVMAAGFAALCLGWMPVVSGLLICANEGLLLALLAVNSYFAHLKFLYFTHLALSGLLVGGVYGVLILGVLYKNARDRERDFWSRGS